MTIYDYAFKDDIGIPIRVGEKFPGVFTGIASFKSLKIKIDPNSATQFVHLKVPDDFIHKVDVFDINGQLIKTSNFSTFSMKDCEAGSYILWIETDSGVVIEKLIKE